MKGQNKGESSTEKGKGKGKGKKGESSHRRDEEDDAPVKGKPGKGRGKEKGKGRGKGKGKTEGKGKRKIVWIDGIPHYPGSDVPGVPSGAAAMGVVPPTGWYRDPLTGLWVVPEEEEQPEQPVQPPPNGNSRRCNYGIRRKIRTRHCIGHWTKSYGSGCKTDGSTTPCGLASMQHRQRSESHAPVTGMPGSCEEITGTWCGELHRDQDVLSPRNEKGSATLTGMP